MVDGLRGSFDARRVVVSVDCYQTLRQLTEQLYLVLVLMDFRVERLEIYRNINLL